MKKHLLLSAICATSASIALPALAYDSGLHSGTRENEYHHIVYDTQYDCNNLQCVGIEQDQYWQIKNGGGCLIEPCAPSVEEVIDSSSLALDASGNPIHRLINIQGDSHVPHVYGVGIGDTFANGSQTSPYEYYARTQPNGKFIEAIVHQRAVAAGLDIDGYIDIERRVEINLNGCNAVDSSGNATAAGPSIHVPAELAELRAIPLTDTSGIGLLPNFPNCFVQNITKNAYLTCDTLDECGQFSKSVPVPALASAALAFGLAGITFLSGRRKSLK